MNTSDLYAAVRAEAGALAPIAPNAVWYIFGSAARDLSRAEDVDILIVCSDEEEVKAVRAGLVDFSLSMPIHLVLVTRAEERELDFIGPQECRQLYPALKVRP